MPTSRTDTAQQAPALANRFRLPPPEELDSWDHDQAQRYLLVGYLLDRMLVGCDGPIRVLDVGANVLDHWPRLFPDGDIEFVRCDVERYSDDPNFVVLEPDAPLPFDDESFDAVVALEVLEHLGESDRKAFLADCYRVARLGAIWTCPSGAAEVQEAEHLANAAFEARHGKPHPFLEEHAEFCLPRVEEIAGHLDEFEGAWAVFANAPLESWLAALLVNETLVEQEASLDIRRWANAALTREQPQGASYRNVFVAVKSFDATDALDPLPEEVPGRLLGGTGRPSAPVEPTAVGPQTQTLNALSMLAVDALGLAESDVRGLEATVQERDARHQQTLTDHQHELDDRDEIIRQLEGLLESQRRVSRTLEQRLLFAKTQGNGLARSWSRKIFAPLRRLGRLFRPERTGRQALVAWNQIRGFEDEPETFEATGHDPQFVIPCSFRKGWIRLQYRVATDTPGRLEIFADYGDGFHPGTRIEQCWVGRDVSREVYVHLDRPICGLRLDPLDTEATFQLTHFEARAVPGPVALVRAILGKVSLLSKYSCLGASFWRGVKLLCRGHFRKVVTNLFKGLTGEITPIEDEYDLNSAYRVWRKRRQLTDEAREEIRREIAEMADPVRFSIVMPVYETEEDYLREALDSVLAQLYPHWELCIADDCSSKPHVREILDEYQARDSRIRVVYQTRRGRIAQTSNAALELATGDYIALLDHDDTLDEKALYRVAQAIHADRSLDMVYTDEDKVELDGEHVEPFFKPTWSPEFFQTCMYTCHLGVYRAELVRAVGGFRPEYDSAQDYDLALRIVARTQRIHHVPEVLYHWRKAPTSTATGQLVKPEAHSAARRALTAHLGDLGYTGRVERTPLTGLFRTRFDIVGNPLVSIVIPSACREVTLPDRKTTWIEMCLSSIRQLTTYDNYEIVVVYNESLPEDLARRLEPYDVRLVAFHGEFNLATKMNLGVAHARGEHVVLLNDDIEVITDDWLESMLEYSQQPDVGAVGAKLFFPNGRLQHVGVCLLEGNPGHFYYGYPEDHIGYFGTNVLTRNCSAVTGACVMVRKKDYKAVGGFDEAFYLNFNDVDFCLKLRRDLGKRIVWTPHAQLCHYESVSKDGVHPDELRLFKERWQGEWADDPFYNPAFSRNSFDYRIYFGKQK